MVGGMGWWWGGVGGEGGVEDLKKKNKPKLQKTNK